MSPSLRSIDGVDIGAAIRAAVDAGHLVKGGGHAMAAGLTMERGRLAALEAFLRGRLAVAATSARAAVSLAIEGALTPTAVTEGDSISRRAGRRISCMAPNGRRVSGE